MVATILILTVGAVVGVVLIATSGPSYPGRC